MGVKYRTMRPHVGDYFLATNTLIHICLNHIFYYNLLPMQNKVTELYSRNKSETMVMNIVLILVCRNRMYSWPALMLLTIFVFWSPWAPGVHLKFTLPASEKKTTPPCYTTLEQRVCLLGVISGCLDMTSLSTIEAWCTHLTFSNLFTANLCLND